MIKKERRRSRRSEKESDSEITTDQLRVLKEPHTTDWALDTGLCSLHFRQIAILIN